MSPFHYCFCQLASEQRTSFCEMLYLYLVASQPATQSFSKEFVGRSNLSNVTFFWVSLPKPLLVFEIRGFQPQVS